MMLNIFLLEYNSVCVRERERRKRQMENVRTQCMCFGVLVPLHGPPAWSRVVWATAVH